LLFAPASTLGNLSRRLALPESVWKGSQMTLWEKLIKRGAKGVRHPRYRVFQMAEVVVPRASFGEILDAVGRLRVSAGLAGAR